MCFNKMFRVSLVFRGFSKLALLKKYSFETISRGFYCFFDFFLVGFQTIFESQAEQKVVIPTKHELQKVMIEELRVQREAF
jgi:hypothetical protein